jgi:hypothetical protein
MRLALACAAAVAVLLTGCSTQSFDLSPKSGKPPLAGTAARITAGKGTQQRFRSSVAVRPGNVVQVRTTLGDDQEVQFNVPRGPALSLPASVKASGRTESVGIRSATGRPIRVTGLFEPDPGYVGVEWQRSPSALGILVTVPSLAGATRRTLVFTYKLRVE